MMRFAIGLLFVAALPAHLSAQTVEGFQCINPISITAANPPVVTCPSPHGFNNYALNVTEIKTANVNDGDTLVLDGVTYTWKTTINNSNAREVLIGASAESSAYHMEWAIQDGGFLKGTIYSSATSGAHPTMRAGITWQLRYIVLYAIAPGPAGAGLGVSSNAPNTRVAPDSTATRQEWNVMITGATGCWAGVGGGCTSIGTNQTPRSAYARYVSPTQFSIYVTQTATLNLSGNGSYTGQSVRIDRGLPASGYYPRAYVGESWSPIGQALPGQYSITIPSCPDPTHEYECSLSRRSPENGKTQGSHAVMASFTVTAGVGTITFSPAYPYTASPSGTAQQNLLVGSVVLLRNVTDTAGAWTHTVSLPNSSLGTIANQLVKYVVGTNTVASVQNTDVGGAIGICVSGCGTTGTATIADAGLMTCLFENNYVSGHWVGLSEFDGQCSDIGNRDSTAGGFSNVTQPIGVVQSTGSANSTASVWWNGLNRAYVVQTSNGDSLGQNVTSITINVPGYPDGNYFASTKLPGTITWYPNAIASVYTESVVAPYWIHPYSSSGGYILPLFPRALHDAAGFDPAVSNHLVWWVKWGKSQLPCFTGAAATMGTYLRPGFGSYQQQGQHYYNRADPALYNGQWTRYEYTTTPTHQVTVSDANWDYYTDLYYQGTPYGWHGAGHFFELMNTFYIDLSGYFCPDYRDTTGQTIYMSPVQVTSVANEPEELVKGRTGSWSPQRYQTSDTNNTPTGTAGYDISLAVPKTTTVQYEFRYSTTASMKTIGFSNGLCKNGTTTCGASDRMLSTDGVDPELLWYQSATMAQQPHIWWAIKPISIPVVGGTGVGQNPTWLITTPDLRLTAGDRVTIAGVGSIPNQTNVATSAVMARQTWTRFNPIPYPLGGLSYTANPGGPIKIVVSTHSYLTGQTIQLYGATPTAIRGQYVITVIDANTFTLNGTDYDTACATTCSGGTTRLNLDSTLTKIESNGTASPNTVCTVTLSVLHNIFPGWKGWLWDSPNTFLSAANGTPTAFTVTTTPSASTFAFICPASTPINTTFDTDNPGGNFVVQSFPAIAVAVTGNSAYTSGGSILGTGDFTGFTEIDLAPFTPFGNATSASGLTTFRGSTGSIK